MEFKHVELPDPLHNDAPLLSQLSVRVSSGQKLAIVQLDSDKVNPFELLLERFFDPVKGNLVNIITSFYTFTINTSLNDVTLPHIFVWS